MQHAWLIDPIAQTMEVMALEAGRWSVLAAHVGSHAVRALPFDTVDIPLALLFGEE